MGMGALVDAIDGLVVDDARSLADSDTLVELHRQLARLEAVATRAVGAFDASQAWQVDGARTPAAWLASRCHLPAYEAKRRCRLGRVLRHLPVAEEAWLAGNLTSAHVGLLASARRPRTEELLARDEHVLVGNAKALSFKAFAKSVAYWLQRADPDGAERSDADKHDARSFHYSESFEGMWFGNLTLDPISGAIVSKELLKLDKAMFEADWAEVRDRLGREPAITELRRTPAQRRADALVEMAVRSGSAPEGGRRPEPLFTVLVGWETLSGPVCELSNGTVVAPGTLVPWLDQAWLERVVFESPSRVLDVGVERRLFEGATRRAVQVRDRQCFHPTCEEAADHCQIDHIIPWSADGPTTQSNGRVACGIHNRRRHQRPPPNAPP